MRAEEWKQKLPMTRMREWGTISSSALVFSEEVRDICKGNGCGKYNTGWYCPPAYGSVEECRAKCLSYEKVFVFTGVYELEDSYDFEGMMKAGKRFNRLCWDIRELLNRERVEHLLYANGGCADCKDCTYPDAPCRVPDKLILSLEGNGIYVNKLAESAGVNYINGKNTVTYFGAVFYERKPEDRKKFLQ